MSGEQIAVLIAAIVGAGAFTALVQGAYGRRESAAKTEALRLANASAPMADMKIVVESVQQQLKHMSAEMLLLREHGGKTQTRLDRTAERLNQAMDYIGLLLQENREWSGYHDLMTPYLKDVAGKLRQAGQDMPEPPEPPTPRTEFSRKTDFPSRAQFEAQNSRWTDPEDDRQ